MSRRTARAAVIPEPRAGVVVRELPVPALERDAAYLEVELSEVCGTDVHLQDGLLEGVPYPLIPGHVSIGRLGAIRGSLRGVDGRAFREGDRVTFLDVHGTCNTCWYCRVARAATRCPDRKVYGITFGERDGLAGGWAETLYLRPGTLVLSADRVDPEAFMAGGCSLPTALHAIDRAEIRIGETVAVLGSGPVGLSATILARIAGAGRVFVVGAPADRLAAATSVGAEDVLDFTTVDEDARLSWIRERTGGRGADVTIEATGAPEAVAQAMRMTRDAGRVVVVGQYTDRGTVAFNPHTDLNRKHLDVRGCWGSDYAHFHRAVELVSDPERGRPWRSLALERFGLDRAGDALDAVRRADVVKALIDPHA